MVKLYAILNTVGEVGRYEGTLADAKAATKGEDALSFEQIEVPIDKAGLISHLNGLLEYRYETGDQFNTVVERNDPPVESPNEKVFDLQRAFAEAPLNVQSELAVTAIDRLTEANNALAKQRAVLGETAKPAPAATIEEIDATDELFG